MSIVLTRENLDLIALQLHHANLVKQVTGLELLQHFDSVDGFWYACVEMVTPTSIELKGLLQNTDESTSWASGSKEQVIEIGIRDSAGNLTASNWNPFFYKILLTLIKMRPSINRHFAILVSEVLFRSYSKGRKECLKS
jgi:hypothetical protein